MSTESPEDEVEQIKHCSRLEELLLWNKILKIGDSPIAHNRKVDKLKVLSESLVSSASKAEKCISDIRTQKEEALKFHVTKTSENIGEERYQFDEASNQILQHFKLKENKLSRAIASYRAATVTTPAFSSSFFLLGAFGVVSFKLLAEPFFLAASFFEIESLEKGFRGWT
ncbi:myosin-9 [Dorcoceras hygrometricum]|uniref:Myosin-9 n=1 Tax=Dorcoceras hygrometricum TaxID=472368 RepID=A0A2Z7AUU0_9LAMI|nr:myosin-9 [Dorcoceras hygrometricum]